MRIRLCQLLNLRAGSIAQSPLASKSTTEGPSLCSVCRRAASHFPLECVSTFESRGSSIAQARRGRPYSFDCCLERSEIEAIIKDRPGGEEILARKGRFFELLGRGRRHAIKPDDGSEVLYVVKYEQQHLQELARVAETTGVDLSKLPSEEVTDTILKSFVDSRGIAPAPEQCHLSALSVESLINELKLPVVVARLQNQPPSREFEEHYAFVVEQVQLDNSEFEDITIDCLGMLRQVMAVPPAPDDASTPILVKSLVTLLDRGSDYVEQAAGVLQVVLAGSETNVRTAIENGLINKCVQKISSSVSFCLVLRADPFAASSKQPFGLPEHGTETEFLGIVGHGPDPKSTRTCTGTGQRRSGPKTRASVGLLQLARNHLECGVGLGPHRLDRHSRRTCIADSFEEWFYYVQDSKCDDAGQMQS